MFRLAGYDAPDDEVELLGDETDDMSSSSPFLSPALFVDSNITHQLSSVIADGRPDGATGLGPDGWFHGLGGRESFGGQNLGLGPADDRWRGRSSLSSPEDGYVMCPHCHKPITSYNLNRHIKMVHMNMDKAQCSLCQKMFKNKYSLSTHMHRQHHEFMQQQSNYSSAKYFKKNVSLSLGNVDNSIGSSTASVDDSTGSSSSNSTANMLLNSAVADFEHYEKGDEGNPSNPQ